MKYLPGMKRFAIGLVLSMVACNGVTQEAPAPVVSTDRADEAAASIVTNGNFASIAALCDAQTKAGQRCSENTEVLKTTKLVLGAGIYEVKAVDVDGELALETYLVTHTNAGWSAIRTPIFHDDHDDPGCPSIERATRITSAIVDKGMLVVVNEANRYVYTAKEAGELTLTYVRACNVGAGCGDAKVIYAKAEAQEVENPDAPMHTHLFATTFTISNNGVISPATTYDDALL